MDTKAEELAVEARNSLSNYCYTNCKAYCCRKGFLLLDKKEAGLVSDEQIPLFLKNKTFILTSNGEYSFDLGASKTGCSQLRDFKCMIHSNLGLPRACREFPLFLWDKKKVRISDRCPGTREGMLYSYLLKFKLLGYSESGVLL